MSQSADRHEPLTEHSGKVTAVALLPDIKRVGSHSLDKRIRLWNVLLVSDKLEGFWSLGSNLERECISELYGLANP